MYNWEYAGIAFHRGRGLCLYEGFKYGGFSGKHPGRDENLFSIIKGVDTHEG
jgi:hypothetical protein